MAEVEVNVPKEAILENIQRMVQYPVDNVALPRGERDPQTGQKEAYLKRSAVLSTLFNWITFGLEGYCQDLGDELKQVLNHMDKVVHSKQNAAGEMELYGVGDITDEQVAKVLQLAHITLELLQGDSEKGKQQFHDMWQALSEKK